MRDGGVTPPSAQVRFVGSGAGNASIRKIALKTTIAGTAAGRLLSLEIRGAIPSRIARNREAIIAMRPGTRRPPNPGT